MSIIKARWLSLLNINKRQRIPKGQSKMDNPEKLATQDTHDEEKLTKNTTLYLLRHHYTQANTNNVNKT